MTHFHDHHEPPEEDFSDDDFPTGNFSQWDSVERNSNDGDSNDGDSNDRESYDPQQIDRLLQSALNIQSDPMQPDEVTLARLERFWKTESGEHSQSENKRRSHKMRPARSRRMLAAAAMFFVITLGWASTTWLSPRSTDEQKLAKNNSSLLPAKERNASPTVEDESLTDVLLTGMPVASRPPTALEMVAFYAHTSRNAQGPMSVLDTLQSADIRTGTAPSSQATLSASTKERTVTLLARDQPTTLEEFLALPPNAAAYKILLAHKQSKIAARLFVSALTIENQQDIALHALREAEHPPVDSLFELLDDENPTLRQTAAIALGHRNGIAITQRLIEVVTERNSRHSEAWLALTSCRGVLAKNFLAEAARQPKLLGYFNAARVRWSLPL